MRRAGPSRVGRYTLILLIEMYKSILPKGESFEKYNIKNYLLISLYFKVGTFGTKVTIII